MTVSHASRSILACVLDGVRETVRDFQEKPYRFLWERTLQAAIYARARHYLEQANLLWIRLKVYDVSRHSKPRETEILQCGLACGKRDINYIDIGVFDPQQPDLFALEHKTVMPLAGVELKLDTPRKQVAIFKGPLRGKDNLLCDWAKLRELRIPNAMALWFVSEDQPLNVATYPKIRAASALPANQIDWGHPYVITSKTAYAVQPA